MGGLAAALGLAGAGFEVTVLERRSLAGGKIRSVVLDGRPVDAGPTVLTMRWVLDELFAEADAHLEDHVRLERAELLARHAWTDGTRLDLHADPAQSREEIGRVFGSQSAQAFDAFRDDARRIFETVEGPFLRSQAPTLGSLIRRVGAMGLGALVRVDGLRTMARALDKRFDEPKLRQLFGRYATYCGSSPFDAPAT